MRKERWEGEHAALKLLDKGFPAERLKEVAKWYPRLLPEQRDDLNRLFEKSPKKYQPFLIDQMKEFFSTADQHGWSKYHTSFAFNVLSEEGRPVFTARDHTQKEKEDYFASLVRSWKYLGPWVKTATNPEMEQGEFRRLYSGMVMVSQTMQKIGAVNVEVAHQLLQEKDHRDYPVHLFAVAQTRRIARLYNKTFHDKALAKGDNVLPTCYMTLERLRQRTPAKNKTAFTKMFRTIQETAEQANKWW